MVIARLALKYATQLADVLEDEWDRQLFRGPTALATMLGWTSYHTLRSKGSKSGYPDRTLVRDRIIFAELKREKAKPTPDQVEWLNRLAFAGGEVYLWRPSDLEDIARILSKQWEFVDGTLWERDLVVGADNIAFRPVSLWTAGTGRADTTPRKETACIRPQQAWKPPRA